MKSLSEPRKFCFTVWCETFLSLLELSMPGWLARRTCFNLRPRMHYFHFSPKINAWPPSKFWPIIELIKGFLKLYSDPPRTPCMWFYGQKRGGKVEFEWWKIRGFPDWMTDGHSIEDTGLAVASEIRELSLLIPPVCDVLLSRKVRDTLNSNINNFPDHSKNRKALNSHHNYLIQKVGYREIWRNIRKYLAQ